MIKFSKVIAIVLVLLSLLLAAYAWMLSRQPAVPVAQPVPAPTAAAAPAAATYPVVVAARALPAGQVIEASALRVVQLPMQPTGAFRSVSDVEGRVPVFDLGSGSPLLEAQLVSGLALRLESGERAVAVKVDEVIGVGNTVRPGDFVDVFFAIKADGKDVERSQSRLLLARKRVLAYGSASVDGLPPNGDGRPQKPAAQAAARTAVLAVPVEEVNRLALGDATGQLLLALRNPDDTAEPDPALFAPLPTALRPARRGTAATGPLKGMDLAQAGLTAADLAEGGSASPARPAATPMPARRGARPAAESQEIEIIRGDRRDTARY
ncbi:Flp pilus assembly protein CpaB [Hydrogenophaga sp.]|uniref:Flp pilus assembly protein CpaB n=1 Tax=Hydrogenophaga sp. TaxID=1904254 RepID=UPI002633302A|nr:Flp pilus assembly protein CpaB [Hydrogenophaga sp.]MCW5652856.1 Flp pilus assembly protein CpaB [Hydrogenophaga sp.]